jgi:hypothetical protein
VDAVRAGLGDDVDVSSGLEAKFGGVGSGLDLEFLDGIDGGIEGIPVVEADVHGGAVEVPLVVGIAGSVSPHRDAAGKEVLKRGATGNAALDVGGEQGKVIEVTAVQGEFDHAAVVDDIAVDRIFGIDHGNFGGDVDRFGNAACLKCDIEAGDLRHLENDAFVDLRPEAGRGDGELVGADGEVGEDIVAVGVRVDFAQLVGVDRFRFDVRPRNDCSGGVLDGAGNTGRSDLPVQW